MTSYNSYALEHDIHVNDVVRSIRIPLSEEDNPLIRCFNEKQPRNIRNGVSEGRLPGWLAELLGTDTLAIAPMVCKHRCVGLLLADNLINRKPIGEDSIRLLMVFANLASQAIEQSRLYMSLEEKITSLDNAYRQLKESRDLLVRSEKLSAVGEVAANVAHEIRNPLVSIGGFARSLAEDQKTDKASRKKLRIIVEEVERLERYLQHTLAFIRPNLPAFQPSDPYRLVMETFQMMDAEIRDSQVRIDIEQLDEPPALELDAEQIRQVLLNIFRNAIEAMPDGGCLNVTFTRDQDYFTFNIADTGVGIDKSIVENLFTAFFTTKSTGSGLGLAISSQIIQNHGGTIGISIPEEAGAVFHITLPIRQSVKDREDL
ncbi:MAG: ATP-binding protein [Gemmatimonadota bacterium]|nr:ATP-binding protein [Gemmatimonadota bacterium]